MRVHFIAIGGSVMHNLAIALHNQGFKVSGSDDEIFDPARSKLARFGILPESTGWDENRIDQSLDMVIVGMHARSDNPELIKARSLRLKIFSFPEYLYEHSKNKIRVVIGGSHGKTTITSMIMHVLRECGKDFDYMVGASLEGFDIPVRLSDAAPMIILEGDEYPDSAINKTPKFHLYEPQIALLSGIAWDHVNVFPTFENYLEQFSIFIEMIPAEGALIYSVDDRELKKTVSESRGKMKKIPYSAPSYSIRDGITYIRENGKEISLSIFGHHNLLNMNGAKAILNEIGIPDEDFFNAIKTFKGASKRLELVKGNEQAALYKDFAHSPSKLKATIHAMKEQFPERNLTAVMELHTYSSLSQVFLSEYKDSMKEADERIVLYNPHTLELKRLPMLKEEDVKQNFNDPELMIFTSGSALMEHLMKKNYKPSNLLMMSSGNFDGLDMNMLKTKFE